MKNIYGLVAFGLVVLGLSGKQAAVGQSVPPPNTDPNQVQAIVQGIAEKEGLQGVEFGMWVGNREVLVTALGKSMTTVPAATKMHFRTGGISETFMSTLLLMLAEQGRINLDETISRWFPHLLGADKVTPRMLVANTAGYIDYVTVPDLINLQNAEPFRTITDDELINFSVRDGLMSFAPGSSQAYSHTDNVILGQVIQRATEESMNQLYEENIFGPLGLKDTKFPTDQEIQEPVLHAFTSQRNLYEDCTYWNPSWGSTPGAITSNLRDMHTWAQALGTGRLISPADFQAQIAPTTANEGAKNKPDAYFAYGVIVANGWLVQDPNLDGYSGAFGYNMATGVTIMVMSTQGEKTTDTLSALNIFREVANYATPNSPIVF
jgi:D-alanyl-D-alanine carboxypeptidase